MKTHTNLIIGNWKMNTDITSAQALASEIISLLQKQNNLDADIAIAPPYPFLPLVQDLIKKSAIGNLCLAAQNICGAQQGAFTGEVSGQMLKSIGTKFVLIGHSERRALYAECGKTIAKKVRQALACGLIPVLCVGETETEKENGLTEATISKQIADVFCDSCANALSIDDLSKLIVAYEPVWAIGTGKIATASQADQICGFIRKTFPSALQNTARILYGGSVTSANSASLMAMPNINGVLVGGASLKADEFANIIGCAKL